jgi:hypothetical protein
LGEDQGPVTQAIRVLDADGTPLAGLRVALCPEKGSAENWICPEGDLDWETTDPEGVATYTFSSWRVEELGRARIAGFDPTALPESTRLVNWSGWKAEGKAGWPDPETGAVWLPPDPPMVTVRLKDSITRTQNLTVAIPDGKAGARVSLGLDPYFQDGHFGDIVDGPGGYTAWWSDARARAMRQWTTLDADRSATFTVLPGKTYQVYYAGDTKHGPQNLPVASPPDDLAAKLTLPKLAVTIQALVSWW